MECRNTWSIGLLALALNGCGTGADSLAHIGICDGYPDWSQSEYLAPWEVGVSREISQGNCSAASHYGSSRYAYDISMDIASSVLAARAGTVIEVVEEFSDGSGCPDDNHVMIEHADGTVAGYVHLTQDGVLVSLGDTVTAGQAIALSGNSGCSTGAHLHFEVWRDRSLVESIPITFRNVGANPQGVLAGRSYLPQ